jgi:hypothetical protein
LIAHCSVSTCGPIPPRWKRIIVGNDEHNDSLNRKRRKPRKNPRKKRNLKRRKNLLQRNKQQEKTTSMPLPRKPLPRIRRVIL